jgi:2-haloacid dehalogenase
LFRRWGLEGVYNEDEIKDLSRVWHFLDPWQDSASGLHKLGTKFITSTLSNGTRSLLRDLDERGSLGFKLIQSSEDFKAYKPHPSVYLGAAKKMDVKPKEVAMVAAHLRDLKAARSCGFKTIYVERKLEDEEAQEEYRDAKDWVDMWVTEAENGFLEVARRFGIE